MDHHAWILALVVVAAGALLQAGEGAPALGRPVLRTSLVADAEGWTQGVRCEVFNAHADRAIALVVRDLPADDVRILLSDDQGKQVSEFAPPKTHCEHDYRYQIVMPRTSFVRYLPVPARIVDRTDPERKRLIPVPEGTYALRCLNLFTYTLLAPGADAYVEVAGVTPEFGRVLGAFPTTPHQARIGHARLVADFGGFLEDTLGQGPRSR